MSKKPTIAIIGGSFAGLSVVLKLRKRLGNNVTIKLFDFRDYFCYIPALHEGILAPKKRLDKTTFSLQQYFPKEFIHEGVDTLDDYSLTTNSGAVHTFDYCVIATGSRTNLFGNAQREKNGYTMRYYEDVGIVNTQLQKKTTKTITVIGGGYTGIETAAMIALRKRAEQHVRVVHSGPRLFHRLGESISKLAIQRLQKHNVEVIINEKVDQIGKHEITLKNGETLPSDLTIVSTGIKINDELVPETLTFHKQYHAQEKKHIYMCGDVATHGLYTTAHNAMMEGRRVGDLIADTIAGHQVAYASLYNWDKLAIALGPHDGILTNGKKGCYFPRLTGFSKRVIEQRVLIEFKYRIMFWI